MTAFNPLTAILTQNKLEVPNYVDWKRNLDIVLIAEEYKFVLDEHQSMESAYDILENPNEIFGDQNAAKQTAMKALLNTKMVEGSYVMDHVQMVISLLNELKVLGANIDKDTQVDMILQTLPDSFQQFRLNYNMNKMDLSLAKLLNELQSAETIIKQQAPHVSLHFEAKGKCYHCKKPGHHKKQCSDYLAKLNNKPGDLYLLVVKTLLAAVSIMSWCIDSGATNHVCTYLQGFQINDELFQFAFVLLGTCLRNSKLRSEFSSFKVSTFDPYRIVDWYKPNLRHIRVWGCPAHVLKGKTDKLEARTDVCVFVGYPKGTKGGLFYCPKEKKVIVSTNTKFLEEDYLMNHVPRSKLVLQKLSKGMEIQSSEKQNDQMQTPEVDFDIPLHFSSGRNVNRLDIPQEQVPEVILPQSSGSYVEQTAQQEEVIDIPMDNMETQVPDNDVVQPQDHNSVVATDPTSEPVNYDKALHDKYADKWVAAMKLEMGSMYSNQVWDLVEPPDGVKPFGCKWIYKKKRGVDG
ncbi:uncharacterized protein [Nicotiana tomentosiformis]|uniref:uncharacterized protein n=1 Tax=Nicotiana tomentosiformis TaxID=4098 RepID=UPI00388C94F1